LGVNQATKKKKISMCRPCVVKAYWGSGGIAPRILDLGTRWELSGQLHPPAALTPKEISPGTHWITAHK